MRLGCPRPPAPRRDLVSVRLAARWKAPLMPCGAHHKVLPGGVRKGGSRQDIFGSPTKLQQSQVPKTTMGTRPPAESGCPSSPMPLGSLEAVQLAWRPPRWEKFGGLTLPESTGAGRRARPVLLLLRSAADGAHIAHDFKGCTEDEEAAPTVSTRRADRAQQVST